MRFVHIKKYNMQDIAIYGAGGYGKEIACIIIKLNEFAVHKGEEQPWRIVGYFDDGVEKGKAISHYGKVLGGIAEVNAYEQPLALALAIGNPRTRKKIAEQITNPHICFPNLIYPDIWYADKSTFEIGQGNIIGGGCTISCDVKLGDFNVLNGFVNIGHDTHVDDYNSIMPGVRISGEVHIGEENMIGANSFIIQQLKIGTCVTVGVGAILLTKPKDGCTYIGNPAKMLKY